MSHWLSGQWRELPVWMRVIVGLQVIAIGLVLYLRADHLGGPFRGGGPGGFTIGFGIAVVLCCFRQDADGGDKSPRADA